MYGSSGRPWDMRFVCGKSVGYVFCLWTVCGLCVLSVDSLRCLWFLSKPRIHAFPGSSFLVDLGPRGGGEYSVFPRATIVSRPSIRLCFHCGSSVGYVFGLWTVCGVCVLSVGSLWISKDIEH